MRKIKEVMLNLISKAKEVAVEIDLQEVVVDAEVEAVVVTIKILMIIVKLTISSTKKFKTIANMDASKEVLLM